MTKQKLMNAREVSDNIASGRGWISIMSSLCPELDAALAKPGQHVDCPLHQGKGDFRAFHDVDNTGRFICTCQTSGIGPFNYLMLSGVVGTFGEALKMVAQEAGLSGSDVKSNNVRPEPQARPNRPKKIEFKDKPESIRAALAQLAKGSVSTKDPRSMPIDRYLNGRGIPYEPSKALRYHPSCSANIGGEPVKSPCMLALISGPKGEPITFHRTFITEKGQKAFGSDSKMLYSVPVPGTEVGGAIRLFEEEKGDWLNVTEGIETAYAARAITRESTWSAVNTRLLEQLHVDARFNKVRIWADRDPRLADRPVKVKPNLLSGLVDKLKNGVKVGMQDLGLVPSLFEQPFGPGLKSALRLAMRLIAEGKQVEILLPAGSAEDKLDWLDVYNQAELGRLKQEDLLAKARTLADRQVISLTENLCISDNSDQPKFAS